jgi:flagellar hook-length control protein FliK
VAELARMARISADGTARLTVRLDPPELGAVTLHLTSRGDGVELSLRADTPAGAAALAGQQTRVRDLLASHGFDLSTFTISTAEGAGLRDSGRGRDNPGGDFRGNDGFTAGDPSSRDARDDRSGKTGAGFDDFGDGSRSGSRPFFGNDPSTAGTDRTRTPSSSAEGTWL